jgi:hypothetical protein
LHKSNSPERVSSWELQTWTPFFDNKPWDGAGNWRNVRCHLQAGQNLRHAAPLKAMIALNPRVLLSTDESALIPFRMPTIMAKMMTSPTELTTNDMLDNRFRCSDSRAACSSMLSNLQSTNTCCRAEITFSLRLRAAGQIPSLQEGYEPGQGTQRSRRLMNPEAVNLRRIP